MITLTITRQDRFDIEITTAELERAAVTAGLEARGADEEIDDFVYRLETSDEWNATLAASLIANSTAVRVDFEIDEWDETGD